MWFFCKEGSKYLRNVSCKGVIDLSIEIGKKHISKWLNLLFHYFNSRSCLFAGCLMIRFFLFFQVIWAHITLRMLRFRILIFIFCSNSLSSCFLTIEFVLNNYLISFRFVFFRSSLSLICLFRWLWVVYNFLSNYDRGVSKKEIERLIAISAEELARRKRVPKIFKNFWTYSCAFDLKRVQLQ